MKSRANPLVITHPPLEPADPPPPLAPQADDLWLLVREVQRVLQARCTPRGFNPNPNPNPDPNANPNPNPNPNHTAPGFPTTYREEGLVGKLPGSTSQPPIEKRGSWGSWPQDVRWLPPLTTGLPHHL